MNVKSPPLAGVIGWPVAHSRSPRLFSHWLERYEIDGYYVPLGLPPDAFEQGLRSLPRLGFKGVNVTIPHKETAFALADSVSDRAAAIGAANTLVFGPDGAVHADNTDGFGFIENLRQSVPGWAASNGAILVLGAGGAARGVIAALLAGGGADIRIANRTKERAEALKDHFGRALDVVTWSDASEAADGAATIINTTSMGMHGQPALPFSLDAAGSEAIVADLVYQPLETPLLAGARQRGLVAVDGLGMLLHQAVPGFERWFGVRPEVDGALRDAVLGR